MSRYTKTPHAIPCRYQDTTRRAHHMPRTPQTALRNKAASGTKGAHHRCRGPSLREFHLHVTRRHHRVGVVPRPHPRHLSHDSTRQREAHRRLATLARAKHESTQHSSGNEPPAAVRPARGRAENRALDLSQRQAKVVQVFEGGRGVERQAGPVHAPRQRASATPRGAARPRRMAGALIACNATGNTPGNTATLHGSLATQPPRA